LVALITGVVTIIAAIISNYDKIIAPSRISTIPSSTSTSIHTPITTSHFLSTSSPVDASLTSQLVEVFPQVDGGKDFVFIQSIGVLTPEFVGDKNCVHSGEDGLRLTYDMQGEGTGGWGIHWANPPQTTHFDASEFRNLVFWVKGMSGGEKFQVALKDTNDREVWIETSRILEVTQDWQLATVQLHDFWMVNISSIENLNFGFNGSHGSGSICIDDIAFTP
jgi:hypothetical protein